MSYIEKELDWQDTAGQNYIVRHWLGHLPLPISYWVNGVVIPFAFSFGAQAAITQIARTEIPLRWLSALDLAYLAVSAALWIWSVVGIWRSAGFHEERGGSPGWANFARAVVIIGAIGALLQSQNRVLYVMEEGKLAFGQDPLGNPANIGLLHDRTTALVDGNITSGTAARFRSFIDSHPQLKAVNLRSHGGRMLEADRMAKLINRRGLNTEAQEYCESACTLLLLAGKERAATEDAKVGFHQPNFPGLTASEQSLLTSDLREMYVKDGVDSGFLDQALSVSPANMWFPSVDELISAKVITTSPIVVSGRSKMEMEMRNAQLERYLDYTASQINAGSPLKVDALTTRTGARATPQVLTIRFRVAADKTQVDAAAARRKLTPGLTKQVCDGQETSLAVDVGATFVFAYYDDNGRLAFSIPVSDCKSAGSN